MLLTDLEYTVLGNVWKKGECSGYEVLQEFARSTAAYYRSREGAIYPLLARLERRRLIKGRSDKQGRRARRLYSITPTGLAALKFWLAGPIPEADTTVPPDLVRTRVYFLGAISPAKRRAMVRDTARRVREQLTLNGKKKSLCKKDGNLFGTLAIEGIVRSLEARLEWLLWLEKEPRLTAPTTGTRVRRTPRQTTGSPRRPRSRRR